MLYLGIQGPPQWNFSFSTSPLIIPNINLLLDLSGIFCMLAIHIFIFELSYLTAEFILRSE